MGLFSRKKTYIESSTQLLVEDTPNLIKDATVNAVLNNRSIADDILASYLDGLAVKAKAMYRYGRDHYTYGLPNGSITYVTPKDSEVQAVIEAEIGKRVLINYNVVDDANPDFWAYDYMQSNRDWDYETNVVGNPPVVVTATVYFHRAETLGTDSIRIHYHYEDRYEQTHYVTEDVTVSGFIPNHVYYHTAYFVLDSLGEITGTRQYWFYDATVGNNPNLPVNEDFVEQSPYYPIVPVREHKKDMTREDVRDTELYKTSKRVLDKISLKFNELGEGVNGNPGIGDVDHAYVMIGVNLQSDKQNSIVYLHDYFTYLVPLSRTTEADYLWWLANNGEVSTPPVNTVTIKDANYRMDLSYNYIRHDIVTGSIGDIGFATRTNVIRTRKDTGTFAYETSSVIFRKQITLNTYEETEVYGIYHMNYVYAGDVVATSLEESINNEGDKNNFIIPINNDVARNMGLMEHNALMYDSIRIVFNSKVTKKLKWYETGFFKIVTIVVAIVITIYSVGTMTETIFAAYAAGGAVAAAAAVAQMVIQAAVFSMAAEWVVDQLGIEVAFAVMLILAAYSYTNNNPKLASGSVAGTPFSIDLLSITGAIQEGITGAMEDQLQDILDEIEELAAEYDALMEEIEEMDDNGLSIDPMELVQAGLYVDPYETTSQFYTRTIHTGNIGVLALDAPSVFVEGKLQLELPDSQIRITPS